MIRMPYLLFDTEWIRSVVLTGWFALVNGLLPQLLFYLWWNNCAPKIMMILETISRGCMLLGSVIIHFEHQVFSHVDFFGPIFGVIQYIGSLIPEINLGPDNDVILAPVPPMSQGRNKFQAPSRCGRPNVRSCTSGKSGKRGRKGCREHNWWSSKKHQHN